MSGLRELDVSDPVLDPRGSLNSRADSLALLGSIIEATPSLRRLSAHGWGKGFPDTATALAQALALHPVSLHSLSVGHATAVSPCESPVSSCKSMDWCFIDRRGDDFCGFCAQCLYSAGMLPQVGTLSACLNELYPCTYR